MTDKILSAIRAVPNMQNAVMRPVEVNCSTRNVTVNIVTDTAFTQSDKTLVAEAVRPYVPRYFNCRVEISKLTPDCEMVKRRISEIICADYRAVFATLEEGDICVEKTENGFNYTVAVMSSFLNSSDICAKITAKLKKHFCGEFNGECVRSSRSADEIKVEDKPDEIEFEIPVRTFKIEKFEFLEGAEKHETAIYMSDLNFAGEDVVICGTIEDIRERNYVNKRNQEKTYLSLVLNDTTASAYVTYFIRQKSADKIKALKVGDSIVCTGKNEFFRGNLRFTANTIDMGSVPKGFVPETRQSKPVPRFYKRVIPQPFIDAEQTNFLVKSVIPDCLKGKTFVVFDLETTGLNSSPVSGNMDKIIEIGAYKVEDGEIKESFTTFINPEIKLSDEISSLTGITQDMVTDAPTYEEAMPDFYKFCHGSILVGHNIAGFDYKFVDYNCARLGYILERKLIDTIPLAQELIFVSNYKLNTVADHFGITFNHHRAIDDALATAKVFIELIKIKKSLPKLQ